MLVVGDDGNLKKLSPDGIHNCKKSVGPNDHKWPYHWRDIEDNLCPKKSDQRTKIGCMYTESSATNVYMLSH